MRATSRPELLLLAPAAVFLFILPFPHTVALRLLCLFASFVLAVFVWRRFGTPAVPLKLPILAWVLAILLSLAFAVDLPYSIREMQNEVGYSLIAFAALFVLSRDESSLRWFCLAVAAAFLVIALSGLADYVWNGYWGIWKFYGGAGTISNYFVTALPLLALAVHVWNLPRARIWLAGGAVVLACAGTISLQRSLWLGLAAQAIVVCVWLWRRPNASWGVRRSIGIGCVVLCVIAAGFLATENRRTRAEIGGPEASTLKDSRPAFWLSVTQRIAENPFRGAGFGQRALVKAHPDLVPEGTWLWHAHNLVLNYGVYAGVPGMAAILLLFAAMFWRFWRLARSADRGVQLAGLAGAAMVAGVFARNTFNDFFIRDGALLFWGLAGMLLGYALRRSR